MNIPAVVEASLEFGKYVHLAAVRFKSKSILAQEAGVDREVIVQITSGRAHAHEREVLEKVVGAMEPKLRHPEVTHMRHLIDKIKMN